MKDEALVLAARALTVAINGSMTARWKQGEEALDAVNAALDYEQHSTTDSEMFKIRSAYRKGFEHGIESAMPASKPLTEEEIFACENSVPDEAVTDRDWCIRFARAIEAKLREKNAPQSKPLTDEQIMEMYNEPRSDAEMIEFARAIEAAHGIGEQK